MKRLSRSLLIATVFLFSLFAFNITSFANDDYGPVEENLVSPETLESSTLSLTKAGLVSVKAYPSRDNKYYSNYYDEYYNPYGLGMTANIKLKQSTKDCFTRNNCDSWYFVVELNCNGVYKADIQADGSTLFTDNLQNTVSRKIYYITAPAYGNNYSSRFSIILHDLTNVSTFVNGWVDWN